LSIAQPNHTNSYGPFSVLPEDEINDADPTETQVHKETHRSHDEVEGEYADNSPIPEGEENRGTDDILSNITGDDQKEIFELNRMLFKLLFELQAE
jgi:hypothetical protein